MANTILRGCALALAMLAIGCTDDEASVGAAAVTKQQVTAGYAEIVYMSYADAHDRAVTLKQAVDAFVAAPSPALHEAAKRAWLEARYPYLQTEAYRFYAGPIDDEDGPEGRINAWPLDEIYIDYVEGVPDAGIVNDPAIELTKQRLTDLSEGNEGDIFAIGMAFDPAKAISTGYHAIEFLLWGQDLGAVGPGARSWQDYITTADATAPNGDRRGLYLKLAAELLVDDLGSLLPEWAPDSDNYRKQFVEGDADDALRKMFTAIGILSKAELAGERMDVALDSLDQEDEHSCFSDNTHVDIAMDALGVQNVYLGRYRYHDGPGIDDLVEAADPALNAEMKRLLETSLSAIDRIPVPFDQDITSQGSEGWNAVDNAVGALFDQGDKLVGVAQALGLGAISVELPQ